MYKLPASPRAGRGRPADRRGVYGQGQTASKQGHRASLGGKSGAAMGGQDVGQRGKDRGAERARVRPALAGKCVPVPAPASGSTKSRV